MLTKSLLRELKHSRDGSDREVDVNGVGKCAQDRERKGETDSASSSEDSGHEGSPDKTKENLFRDNVCQLSL